MLTKVYLKSFNISLFSPYACLNFKQFCTQNSNSGTPTAEELAAKKAANAVRAQQKQVKLISEVLGTTNLISRALEILDILINKHLSYFQNSALLDSPIDGTTLAAEFLESSKGRKFIVSFIYKGFSTKSGPFSTTDTRLVKFAESYLDLLPALCVFLDSGVLPANEMLAKQVSAMAKSYLSFAA